MNIYSIGNKSRIQASLYSLTFRNKYDLMANEISREIFQSIIADKNEFHKEYQENKTEVHVTIERANTDYVEEVKGHQFSSFITSAYSDGKFDENKLVSSIIFVKIILARGFSEKDYESINYRLYEVVRHEIEHEKTFEDIGMTTEEYNKLFSKIFNDTSSKTLKEHCSLISQYILDPQELPSYAKSIYYVAKKSGKDFRMVVNEILNRSFYSNISPVPADIEIANIYNSTQEAIIRQINMYYPNSIMRMQSLYDAPFYNQ